MAAARGKKKEKENGGLPSFISLEGKTGWERTVEEKVIMYYDSFSIFDRSNAMEITRTDLLKCLRSLGHDLTETQVTDHMTALGHDPGAARSDVSFADFVHLMSRLENQVTAGPLDFCFCFCFFFFFFFFFFFLKKKKKKKTQK
jgi:hypothetical protein